MRQTCAPSTLDAWAACRELLCTMCGLSSSQVCQYARQNPSIPVTVECPHQRHPFPHKRKAKPYQKINRKERKKTHPPFPTQTRFPLICTLPFPSNETTTGVSRFTRPPSNKTVKSEFSIAHSTLSLFMHQGAANEAAKLNCTPHPPLTGKSLGSTRGRSALYSRYCPRQLWWGWAPLLLLLLTRWPPWYSQTEAGPS